MHFGTPVVPEEYSTNSGASNGSGDRLERCLLAKELLPDNGIRQAVQRRHVGEVRHDDQLFQGRQPRANLA
jgi:hypothetical protein